MHIKNYFIRGNNYNLHIQFFIIVLITLFNEKIKWYLSEKKNHTTTLRIAKIMSYN